MGNVSKNVISTVIGVPVGVDEVGLDSNGACADHIFCVKLWGTLVHEGEAGCHLLGSQNDGNN